MMALGWAKALPLNEARVMSLGEVKNRKNNRLIAPPGLIAMFKNGKSVP